MQINEAVCRARFTIAQRQAKALLVDINTFEGKLKMCLNWRHVNIEALKNFHELMETKAKIEGGLCFANGYFGEFKLLAELESRGKTIRGHDYLKMFFKYFFVFCYSADSITVDAATHNALQNLLTHDEKNELIKMIKHSI